jgi:hypothetical protein
MARIGKAPAHGKHPIEVAEDDFHDLGKIGNGMQLAQGMDFYELAPDGRIRRVVGFFGAPPMVAP